MYNKDEWERSRETKQISAYLGIDLTPGYVSYPPPSSFSSLWLPKQIVKKIMSCRRGETGNLLRFLHSLASSASSWSWSLVGYLILFGNSFQCHVPGHVLTSGGFFSGSGVSCGEYYDMLHFMCPGPHPFLWEGFHLRSGLYPGIKYEIRLLTSAQFQGGFGYSYFQGIFIGGMQFTPPS